MAIKSTRLFFVDTYCTNEHESAQTLEMGVLRWTGKDDERPDVYVHTYLAPAAPSRVRWTNASIEMKISRAFLEAKGDLPNIDDMIEHDFLAGRNVVCFDLEDEPFHALTRNSSSVISIKQVWSEIYKDDEKALNCTTVAKMCEYVGILPDDEANTNYTPLLKRLHQMVALWQLLAEFSRNPKARLRNTSGGGMQFNLIWPLPQSKVTWFESNPSSFADLKDSEIAEFFDENIADRINWFEMNMYACDWVFKRLKNKNSNELENKRKISEFIFNRILSFKMQMWVLIFFAVYYHRKEHARKIAIARGNFGLLTPAVSENFSSFIIMNLEYFLNKEQKIGLISALLQESFKKNDQAPFEHYDYDLLSKKPHHEVPGLHFRDPSSGNLHDPKFGSTPILCIKEITNATGRKIYCRFEIKGRGKERQAYIEGVNRQLNNMLADARKPFSDFWLTLPLKMWIQYICGVNFSDITRPQKMNDPAYLNSVRSMLRALIETDSRPYLNDFYHRLCKAIQMINQSTIEVEPICFNFQGCSVEIVITPPSKGGFFKKMFSFH